MMQLLLSSPIKKNSLLREKVWWIIHISHYYLQYVFFWLIHCTLHTLPGFPVPQSRTEKTAMCIKCNLWGILLKTYYMCAFNIYVHTRKSLSYSVTLTHLTCTNWLRHLYMRFVYLLMRKYIQTLEWNKYNPLKTQSLVELMTE